jgi:hypothetical protein
MKLTKEERKQKGRENRAKQQRMRDAKENGTFVLPHYKLHLGQRPPTTPRVPRNQKEMQMHLSGKHVDKFRDPITRAELREWEKYWKMKGKGFTKSEKR